MKKSSRKKKYNAISLFSGAMGLDIGLENTKRFKVLACVENDPSCIATIELNREMGNLSNRNLKIFQDIKKISPKELLEEIGKKTGEIDLLVGGPPCQSFSTAGRRGTIQDPRGALIWDFFRFVKEIRPRFFLMENVRGLLSAAKKHRPIAERGNEHPPLTDEEKPGSVARLLLSDFENEGYRVDVFEVNAVNYGAPQLRERVLFIGNKYNMITAFPEPTHILKEEYDESMKQKRIIPQEQNFKPFRTLGDAIQGLDEKKHEVMDFSPRKKEFLSMVPPGGNWRVLPEDIQKESMGKAFHAKGGRSGWWRRLSYDLPSPCLITMPNHAGTSLCHPEFVRALSVKEYARIQEFPDTWEFAGKLADKYRQIGNAVPIRLGFIASRVVADNLDKQAIAKHNTMKPGDDVMKSQIIYIKSHIRTRKWYKDGKAVINGSSTGLNRDDISEGSCNA